MIVLVVQQYYDSTMIVLDNTNGGDTNSTYTYTNNNS